MKSSDYLHIILETPIVFFSILIILIGLGFGKKIKK